MRTEYLLKRPLKQFKKKTQKMIQVANTIISEDIIDNDFVCNLSSCKGACCIEGDAGAPVEESELRVMKRIYPEVEPYLTDEGRAAIEAQGVYVKGEDGDWETPLINGGECAYVVRNEKITKIGRASCRERV